LNCFSVRARFSCRFQKSYPGDVTILVLENLRASVFLSIFGTRCCGQVVQKFFPPLLCLPKTLPPKILPIISSTFKKYKLKFFFKFFFSKVFFDLQIFKRFWDLLSFSSILRIKKKVQPLQSTIFFSLYLGFSIYVDFFEHFFMPKQPLYLPQASQFKKVKFSES